MAILAAVLLAYTYRTVGAFSTFTCTPSTAFKAKSRSAHAASAGADAQSALSSSSSLAEEDTRRLDQSPTIQPAALRPPPFGGDYAGLMATFDAHTGKLIPVPEHYIPQSLLEWGQVPSALEVLVSEEEHESKATTTTTTTRLHYEPILMKRQSLTILPETGCGVDNLETIQEDEPELVLDRKFSSSWSSGTTNNQQQSFRIETAFGLLFSDDDENKNEQQQHQNPYRSRICIDLALVSHANNGSTSIQPTQIRIYLERQIQTNSTGGTAAKGGGLDAQRVARWMGPNLSSRSIQSFAETAPSCTGSTKQNMTRSDDDISDAVVCVPSPNSAQVLVHTVSLPANATVQYIRDSARPTTLSVAVGQVDSIQGSRQWVIHHLAVQSGNIIVDQSYDILTEP